MKIIAIANSKGGSGKTTTMFNLLGEMARQGYKVLGLDMDPQTSFTSCYKYAFPENQLCLEELINSERMDPNQALVHISDKIDIIPSSPNLEGCRYYLEKDAHRLSKVIGRIKSQYNYIFIDAPGTTDDFMGAVLCAAHEVIIPARPSELDLKALVEFSNKITLVKQTVNPDLIIRGILFNQVVTTSKNASYYKSLLKDHELGKNLLNAHIRSSTAVQNSPCFGVDVGAKEPDSKAADDFKKLAQEVISWQ